MKHLIRFFLLSLSVLSAAATADDAPQAMTAEQHYQRAVALSDEVFPELEQTLSELAQGNASLDMSLRYLAARGMLGQLKASMHTAAALDYPPAMYWQSRLLRSDLKELSGAEAAQDCERLQEAEKQGLLAAAVARVYRCAPKTQKYQFFGPERVALAEALKKALEQDDPYIAAYPLVLPEADCFGVPRGLWLPTVDAKGWLQTLREDLSRALSYDQFRAEAYLFIARNLWNEQSLAYLEKAEALGCQDRFKSRRGLEAIKARSG